MSARPAERIGDTVVHLLRHGEVHNPGGVLYGRLDGYHLSELGARMAEQVAASVKDRDITHLVASPLERARETAAPIARERALEVHVDERVIESASVFQGRSFARGARTLLDPRTWRHLRNPFRPSWGEPYEEIAARMMGAVRDARDAARGHEAVVVSHQLPIWTTRLHAESRRFVHSPRSRQCTLCSLTSLHYDGDRLVRVTYSEPAGDLIPVRDRKAAFSSGGSPRADRAGERAVPPDSPPEDPSARTP